MTFQYILSIATDIELIHQLKSHLEVVKYLVIGGCAIQSFVCFLKERKLKKTQKRIDALNAKIRALNEEINAR